MANEGGTAPAVAAADDDYIKTMTHNFVSRKAVIEGAKRVEIKGRSILHQGVKVRGDLQIVKIGRYCEIGASTSLEPPENPFQQDKRVPMIIGSHTHIGKECSIRGAAIGSMVSIGDNVEIGKRCIIKDNCVIESNVVLGDDTVIPPFTLISTKNPTFYQELPPSVAVLTQEVSLDRYSEFKQEQRGKQ
mmetsp:Transcript_22599/g.49135  ORF Transcript_22599/g.49135 Transcript_22599/m.49135 type:complete len:189 (+) Transcript_22599:124-690(+)|eukprot:CAMPEP_0168175952 /NCGR_PEP_ID=MMETSP0139_2-20121125/7466_1 /TAXON_ID=44445 /ORGANISM="Pseudo-nitzschia australis, Strain 10249 10 AB" /LENGTH=188 /DNA_ID=CAMNT_0008094513 /DNA_START=177 /DNA_END=743 /DNA_ORIENTATION=-